ncbi:hypothetical protein [Actinacidiphila glaucinigra]|uniref:hypothetical protein n=1 Tax=Actinacidiphila glaucinigra TaxID=235986 RepID=UPI0015C5C58B|nr:hypothetical protein [Actinacidiphila glaucinigra]
MNVIHHEAEHGTRAATSPARPARTPARYRSGAAPAPLPAGGHGFVTTEDKGSTA